MLTSIEQLLDKAEVHKQWRPLLLKALYQVDADYLSGLIEDKTWLPGATMLFAAFNHAPQNCRYILFGESPYPRQQSANGIAFYDAAVNELWSEKGLSKGVNKATSLRNIMKTALLAEGHLALDEQGKITQQAIAKLDKRALIQTIAEFFKALESNGFLLLNTAPVLHPLRKPAIEARYWQPFIQQLLIELRQSEPNPILILWGKVALQIEALAEAQNYKKIKCEHPYNLSFIQNKDMQTLFSNLALLKRKPSAEKAG